MGFGEPPWPTKDHSRGLSKGSPTIRTSLLAVTTNIFWYGVSVASWRFGSSANCTVS